MDEASAEGATRTSASRFLASEAALRFGLEPLLLLNSSCSLCARRASSSAGILPPICMACVSLRRKYVPENYSDDDWQGPGHETMR